MSKRSREFECVNNTDNLGDVSDEHGEHPCLYILRFAAKLEFGSKTQQVANTALRLVQRMKRDSIHSGRRPSGLCGAALLIAARLHEFSRTSLDIVKIVKVHQSTIRKRLIEFGETPSSALTLDEFMTVDLEEEQDPPSFKTARKKDKERLQKLMEEEADSISELQKQIEVQLKDGRKKHPSLNRSYGLADTEARETNEFIHESTMGTIEKIIQDGAEPETEKGLGPDIASMGLANSLDDTTNAIQATPALEMNLTFDDVDDAELDTYIMSEHEFQCKKGLWHQRNADYLEAQKLKAEKLQKEREEGKPEKKRKRNARKNKIGPVNSAGEAIEKILQEKKISSKINYDVLKSLNAALKNEPEIEDDAAPTTSESIKRRRLSSVSSLVEQSTSDKKKKSTKPQPNVGLPFVETKKEPEILKTPTAATLSEEELDEDFEEHVPDESANEMGVFQMLQKHREDEGGDEEEYGYYEDDY
ncbi:unnamed protein product [Brassicogethes aeneus]|uniref:Cyclin-like domain-containing protein n=1 Tax=Brassicogethes aeneus TaxID=1431903 RepID=A0A9P0AY38_BRAAE|nr:unnamed protein product [Brassicogethes aeneus]